MVHQENDCQDEQVRITTTSSSYKQEANISVVKQKYEVAALKRIELFHVLTSTKREMIVL
jgi:hypothetical protein